ncbi:DUF2273 domain-containing protein [Schleiferilactobacillus perolens]|jgi:uncharacterized membrane protein|uniref:Small integral membrane protein n=1 Tax=Schleiferilactobacillus perolens DSM 12744 TaxID=1423792 RepID=A0A0R1N0W2_9LACO|nr:DUF2273 domain-containing protein [Schleiferilactobacillus perolens]KRL13927.1 hypothetical protein FD09_GL001960 [Schleiferilactobacillus perolens DSM 12744]MCI1892575.1 DUF2273 domain-containing protein [Schleiferilactobacillus harbinensis]MCI1913630.1 DUF2273 domain-containing protein [Schleiferilactobacillus harbinensis]MCI2171186.1 DUF2273 domain-containing protein [Schleiferilactobacillus perolens]
MSQAMRFALIGGLITAAIIITGFWSALLIVVVALICWVIGAFQSGEILPVLKNIQRMLQS